METIELFVQGEGIRGIVLVTVPHTGVVRDVIDAARAHGLPDANGGSPVLVFLEDAEEPLALTTPLAAAGVQDRSSVHVHRVRQITITVNYLSRPPQHSFPPAATVRRVKKWADEQFGLHGRDATEHVLQRCNSAERPDEDTHIGALVTYSETTLCFDLVPKTRVEG